MDRLNFFFMLFHHGLSPAIKDQQVPLDLPEDLGALIALPIKINKWLMEKREGEVLVGNLWALSTVELLFHQRDLTFPEVLSGG